MFNEGNGTCHDKTTYEAFITQHQDKYVMQVKEHGSATNTKPIMDCTSVLRENTMAKKYEEVKNQGGYAVRGGASGIGKSKLMFSGIVAMNMILFLLF